MMNKTYTIEPTTHGLSPVDAAVLIKKYVALLGMMNYGTQEQKRLARIEFIELDKSIYGHLNSSAFDMAKRNLGFSEEDMHEIQQTR